MIYLVKFTSSDIIEIVSACKREPNAKTIHKLMKSYNCDFGDITRIVKRSGETDLAGRLKAENKQSSIEADERHREKQQADRLKKKPPKGINVLEVPSFYTKTFDLSPTQEQIGSLEKIEDEAGDYMSYSRANNANRRTEASYDFVKGFMKGKKTLLGSDELSNVEREMHPIIGSSIRTARFFASVPFDGKNGKNGNGEIIPDNGRILFQYGKTKKVRELITPLEIKITDMKYSQPLLEFIDRLKDDPGTKHPGGKMYRNKGGVWKISLSFPRVPEATVFEANCFLLMSWFLSKERMCCGVIACKQNGDILFRETRDFMPMVLRLHKDPTFSTRNQIKAWVHKLFKRYRRRTGAVLRPVFVLLPSTDTGCDTPLRNLAPIGPYGGVSASVLDQLSKFCGSGFSVSEDYADRDGITMVSPLSVVRKVEMYLKP